MLNVIQLGVSAPKTVTDKQPDRLGMAFIICLNLADESRNLEK
jgi:hypothetical protein